MWSILFIISTAIGVYMLANSVIEFLNYEVVSHINLNFEQPTQFPTVTLIMDYDDSLEKEFILEDYMIGCYFDGWKDCNLTEIEIKFNNITNNFHYKFNSGKNLNGLPIDLKLQKISGPDFGLWIDFFTGFPGDYNNLNSSIHGISIYIHNSSLNPFSEWSLTVSPGYYTSFIVKRTFTSKQGKPYSNCVEGLIFPDSFDSILYKHIVGTAKSTYRQKDCIDLCASQYLINMCNSTSELCFISELWTKNTSSELSDCYDKYFVELTSLDIFGYCSPYCPLECDSLKYDITVRTEPFSFYMIDEFLYNEKVAARFPSGHNVTKDDIKNTVASFSVYYEDLVYTTISQTPKTGKVDLISNMGGLLGLFIGKILVKLILFIIQIY